MEQRLIDKAMAMLAGSVWGVVGRQLRSGNDRFDEGVGAQIVNWPPLTSTGSLLKRDT